MNRRSNGNSLSQFVTSTCLAIACMNLGCTVATEERGRIHGKVSIDGKPLESGQIRFFALTGGIGADGAVKSGEYDIPAGSGMSAGKYRVEFSAERETGRKIPDPDGGPGDTKNEVVEEMPAKFHRNSTLQIDYDPKRDKSHDFELKR